MAADIAVPAGIPGGGFPGRQTLLAAVSDRLSELSAETYGLLAEGATSWDHVDALRDALSDLVTSIDRGKQMFRWFDDLAGDGRTLAARVRRE